MSIDFLKKEICITYLNNLKKYLNYEEDVEIDQISKTIYVMKLKLETLCKINKKYPDEKQEIANIEKYKKIIDNLFYLSSNYESKKYEHVKGKQLIMNICLPIILLIGGILFSALSFYQHVAISSITGLGIVSMGVILGTKLNFSSYLFRWYSKKFTIKNTLNILQNIEETEWHSDFQKICETY